jgi:hypothetical protein
MEEFKEWVLTDFLQATPYGGKKTTLKKIDEDQFYSEDFFIKLDHWNEIGQDIASFFRTGGEGNINTVLLYGYQGAGKTTFLHWALKKSNLFEDYGKMILDMASIPDREANNISSPFFIFDIFFRKQLNRFYADSPDEMIYLLKCLRKGFVRLNNTTFTNHYDDGQSFWDKLKKLVDELNTPQGQKLNIEDENAIVNFFNELNYNDAFILFLLCYFKLDNSCYEDYYYFKKPDKNKKSLIIVFDNIDAIRLEQTNAMFPSLIMNLYWEFCEIINEHFKNDIDVLVLKFIFSIRDYNHSYLEQQNSDNVQFKEIEFDPSESIDKILKKRIEIANKHTGNYSKASALFNIFFDVSKSYNFYLPLFNFDLRKLGVHFSYITEKLSVDDIDNFYLMENSLEKILKEKNIHLPNLMLAYKNGLRGIFFALIIKELMERDNLKPVLLYAKGEEITFDNSIKKTTSQINSARILLTIIHSLSQYTESGEKIRSQLVMLGDVYKEFNSMFKGPDFVDIFFNRLAELFLLHKKNWCHLISFRNKQVFNEMSFDKEKELVKKGLLDNNNGFIDVLNKIEVKINRSAHVYLTKVATHYEFFSMRAKNTESLFLTATKNDKSCLRNMDKVWSIVRPCLTSLINYLSGTNIEDFENTALCLDDSNKESFRKTAMAFRIIHMHLRYIDDFRQYVFFLVKNGQAQIDFTSINKKIIYRQRLYIKKLRTLCEARKGRYDDIYKDLSDNLNKQKEKGYSHYVSLLNDRRNLQSDAP